MTQSRVTIQHADFDLGAEVAALRASDAAVGAVASFVGTVRDRNDGVGVASMELEHYPGMTERAIAAIAEQACARWPLTGCTVIHRHGRLEPGAPIVLVLTASSHRAAALESCAFLIDWLKTKAPFWKREEFAGGAERWVEARASDDQAAARWERQAP